MKFPTDLPIEAVHEVVSILGTLIGLLNNQDILDDSESLFDYQETVDHLNRDFTACTELYQSWLDDCNANEYRQALDKMHIYLMKAETLLKKETFSNTLH